MKQFKLMVEEASALLEAQPKAISDLGYELTVGSLVFGIYYHVNDNRVALKASLAKSGGELPKTVYDLMLSANATGVQLQGCKVGIEAATNQVVLAQLLPSTTQEGEHLAQKILAFTQTALFWQMTLSTAKEEVAVATAPPVNHSMLSV